MRGLSSDLAGGLSMTAAPGPILADPGEARAGQLALQRR